MDQEEEKISYYDVLPSPLLYGESKFGTACAPESWNCYAIWRGEPVINDIQVPSLELRYGYFEDYLDNDCGYNLCSHRLMRIVEENKSASDLIEWYPVEVTDGEAITQTYYILHLPVIFDVLDEDKTHFHGANPRVVISPYFSRTLITDHSVFGYQQSSIAWFVTEKIKDAIERINCTGISFMKAKVTDT